MDRATGRAGLLETGTLWAAVSLAAFTLPALSGCTTNATPEAPPPDPVMVRLATEKERLATVRDVGNGVFVFAGDDMFPETLSDFRGNHPELKVISVSQGVDHKHDYGTNAWGGAGTFVVVTENILK